MKTKYMLLFAALFLSSKSYSQEKKLFLGFKAGLNYAAVSVNSDYFEPGYKAGLCAGINAGYKVHKNMLLLIEANYDQKGYNDPIEFTDEMGNPMGNDGINYDFNYITVPVSINYTTDTKNTFEAGIGFYNSFLMSAQLKLDDITIQGVQVANMNIKEFYNTYEPGIFIRAAETIHLSSRLGLLIEGRYSYGLADINKEEQIKMTNTGFFFGTGLRYYFLTKTE